jgi:hypothetical protein
MEKVLKDLAAIRAAEEAAKDAARKAHGKAAKAQGIAQGKATAATKGEVKSKGKVKGASAAVEDQAVPQAQPPAPVPLILGSAVQCAALIDAAIAAINAADYVTPHYWRLGKAIKELRKNKDLRGGLTLSAYMKAHEIEKTMVHRAERIADFFDSAEQCSLISLRAANKAISEAEGEEPVRVADRIGRKLGSIEKAIDELKQLIVSEDAEEDFDAFTGRIMKLAEAINSLLEPVAV